MRSLLRYSSLLICHKTITTSSRVISSIFVKFILPSNILFGSLFFIGNSNLENRLNIKGGI